ncbi:MAG: hypothetical protein KDD37_07315 [Bdellovibrionales bacterium]|nr:hypothetical protein [Bdellovibrionales bacterium]
MKYVIITICILSGINANAQARKYSNCDVARNIIEPANSQGFYMSEDCKIAYVLPPINGKIKIDNYVQSLTDSQCKAELSLLNLFDDKIAKLEKAQVGLDRAYKDLEKKDAKIQKLKKYCNPLRTIDEKYGLALRQFDLEVEKNEKTISLLESNYSLCMGQEDSDSCDNPKEEIGDLRQAINELNAEKSEYEFEQSKNKIELDFCVADTDREIANIQADDRYYQEESKKLEKARDEYYTLLKEEMKPLLSEAGGHVTVGYYSGHNDLVKLFKAENKNLSSKVEFAPVRVRKAIIAFNRITNGVKAGMPVILKSNIYGVEAPAEDGEVQPEQLISSGSNSANITFGEAASGDMIINKYSACTLSSDFNGLNDLQRKEKFAAMIKPTVVFNYEVQVDRKIGIKYNESHLYQLIKKSSSRRGFFRSRSSGSITEKSESKKWIQISIKSQDDRVSFADSEKMMMDIRREFLDSALLKVAKSYLTEEQVRLQDPGSDGATGAAQQLEKIPNVYAQYAAVALNIGSALFGGSSSEANMTKLVSAQQEELLEDNKMVSEYGQQTLTSEATK